MLPQFVFINIICISQHKTQRCIRLSSGQSQGYYYAIKLIYRRHRYAITHGCLSFICHINSNSIEIGTFPEFSSTFPEFSSTLKNNIFTGQNTPNFEKNSAILSTETFVVPKLCSGFLPMEDKKKPF